MKLEDSNNIFVFLNHSIIDFFVNFFISKALILLCASLGLAGAVGANPFLLIIALIALAKSYTQNKNKNKFKRGSLRGFVGMGSFIMTASLFSSPLLGIIIGLVVAIILKKKMKEIDFSEIYEWFKENL